jgi:lantibiotic biosynthesis protein
LSHTNFEFSVFRTPLYPFRKAFEVDAAQLLLDPIFMEAVFLASPILFDEATKKGGASSANHPEHEKLLLSLYRYWLRACYRCTPFGLFAGLSISKFADKTKFELAGADSLKRNTRLDTHFLSALVQKIIQDPGVKREVKWFTNNTAYPVIDKVRFIKYRIGKSTRTHHLTNVTKSEYLDLILERSRNGSTYSILTTLLISDEITIEDAEAFLDEMISECLLISELEIQVTGAEYHHQLLDKLSKLSSADSYYRQLQSIVNMLKSADENGLGVNQDVYKDVFSIVKQMGIDFDHGKLLQCDLFKTAEYSAIGDNIKKELSKGINVLSRITKAPRETSFQKFRDEFAKRYEAAEVSLLEVLDPDIGLGYPANSRSASDNAPLLTDISLEGDGGGLSQLNYNGAWTKFLMKKIQSAFEKGLEEIELMNEELDGIFGPDEMHLDNLPGSIYTLCSIAASSADDIDKGNFTIHHSTTAGPSAANLLGRFCFLDSELTEQIRNVIVQEEGESPEKIFAEILHISQARLGNILVRPNLRGYEIPILTMSSVDADHTISLDDLMISLRDGRLVLRSKRLNKEVVPRLTTAHNFASNQIPHYHFLCDVQFQNLKGVLSWEWGILNGFSFLPRVRYGKTILSLARWAIELEDITKKKNVSDAELLALLKGYFEEHKVPLRVTISEGDNQLVMDLRNDLCQKIVLQELKKNKVLLLNELFFNENNLFVNGKEGSFTNEIIFPWQRAKTVKSLNGHLTDLVEETPKSRRFAPGSKWFYLKVYCGVKAADAILTNSIQKIVDDLIENGRIEKFFFIRYTDPDHHLRIRFFSSSGLNEISGEISETLSKTLDHKLAWKITIDTYDRELERYGAHNIENSETIFFHDSIASIKILSMLEGDAGDDLRWKFAIKGVNDLLNCFGFGLEKKKNFMSILSSSFMKELGADNQISKKQLSMKFRTESQQISFFLKDSIDSDHEYADVWKIFEERNRRIAECVSIIDKLANEDFLGVEKEDLCASYVHMFLNRFLRSKQRLQEMVIYDLLHGHYKSEIGQRKNANKSAKLENFNEQSQVNI